MNNVEQMRVVCYDIIRQSNCSKNVIICLCNIASGWKESLTFTENTPILLQSIQVCCNAIVNDKKTPSNVSPEQLLMT